MWSLVVLAGWTCALLGAVRADSGIIQKKVGDDVILKPGNAPVGGSITSILWKEGPNIAAQWDGVEVDLYRQFKERGSLNIKSGELTIKGLMLNDSGQYTPEINNKIASPIPLQVLLPVRKPTVKASEPCDETKTSCTLICDGDTTGLDQVTYVWKADDEASNSAQNHHITKEKSHHIKKFSCELKNPVSQESSEPFDNPFYTPPGPNIHVALIVGLSLLATLVLLVVIHRCKAGEWFFQKDSMPWKGDFWRKQDSPSGNAVYNDPPRDEKGNKDETPPMT